MANTLTGTRVRLSYTQILHMDGGPEATEKPVLSGAGAPTALKLGTASASIGNIRLSGNQILPLSGQLVLGNVQIVGGSISGIDPIPVSAGGTGAGTSSVARSNLGLGGMAVQDPSAVNITGGTISGAAFSGAFASTVTIAQISDKRCGQFLSLANQTATANTATDITFSEASAFNSGVSLASASNVEIATGGVYQITASIQFKNAGAADYDATFWFRRGGVDIPASASTVTVPKVGDGGAALVQVTLVEQFTAGQVLSMAWATEHANLSLGYTAATTSPYVAPAVPSVILSVLRVA